MSIKPRVSNKSTVNAMLGGPHRNDDGGKNGLAKMKNKAQYAFEDNAARLAHCCSSVSARCACQITEMKTCVALN